MPGALMNLQEVTVRDWGESGHAIGIANLIPFARLKSVAKLTAFSVHCQSARDVQLEGTIFSTKTLRLIEVYRVKQYLGQISGWFPSLEHLELTPSFPDNKCIPSVILNAVIHKRNCLETLATNPDVSYTRRSKVACLSKLTRLKRVILFSKLLVGKQDQDPALEHPEQNFQFHRLLRDMPPSLQRITLQGCKMNTDECPAMLRALLQNTSISKPQLTGLTIDSGPGLQTQGTSNNYVSGLVKQQLSQWNEAWEMYGNVDFRPLRHDSPIYAEINFEIQ
jgi:hypothetical protein